MKNEYRIVDYDGRILGITDKMDKARTIAGKSAYVDGYIHIVKNGSDFAIVIVKRGDRFNERTGRWTKAYEYFCKELVFEKYAKSFSGRKWAGSYKYYEFSPKTGKIISSDRARSNVISRYF